MIKRKGKKAGGGWLPALIFCAQDLVCQGETGNFKEFGVAERLEIPRR